MGRGTSSAVVVEQELVRVRPQTNFVDLARALVADISLHEIPGEHIALQKELVVALKGVERLVESCGSGGDLRALPRRQVVKVLVDRRSGVGAVLDAVEARHQHRRESEVGIAGGVRTPELDALRLR